MGIWAALRGVQREEAINILRQEGVKEIDDDAFDLIWRATGGSMRRLMAVAELLVAKHAGKPVTERTRGRCRAEPVGAQPTESEGGGMKPTVRWSWLGAWNCWCVVSAEGRATEITREYAADFPLDLDGRIISQLNLQGPRAAA